jgi:hypothetical protein
MDPRLRGDDAVVVRQGRALVALFRRRKCIFCLYRQKRLGLMSFPRRRESMQQQRTRTDIPNVIPAQAGIHATATDPDGYPERHSRAGENPCNSNGPGRISRTSFPRRRESMQQQRTRTDIPNVIPAQAGIHAFSGVMPHERGVAPW